MGAGVSSAAGVRAAAWSQSDTAAEPTALPALPTACSPLSHTAATACAGLGAGAATLRRHAAPAAGPGLLQRLLTCAPAGGSFMPRQCSVA